MSDTNQINDQHQLASLPPTVALRCSTKRIEKDQQCFSSTEIIVNLRQQEFEAIIGRAARLTPGQNPPSAKLPKSISGGTEGSEVRDCQREGAKRLSNRLRDMWPFGRARGGKAQVWG